MKLIKNEDGTMFLTEQIKNPLIEYWVIKYLDEPKTTRNLILYNAQNILLHHDFCELLEILLNATQQDYENAIKNLPKNT